MSESAQIGFRIRMNALEQCLKLAKAINGSEYG